MGQIDLTAAPSKNDSSIFDFICTMPSTQSIAICFHVASVVIALALAVSSGAWEIGGMLGLLLGITTGYIPAMLIVALCFPISAPVIWLISRWLDLQLKNR